MSAHILIVEDEAGIRQLVQDALSEKGFNVTPARNASVARAAIADQLPDVAIIDWMMPQTSGIKLIQELRRDPITQGLPIIMLTARATEDDTIQGLDAGADDYLTKPFSVRELVSRVNAMLRRKVGHSEAKILQHGALKLDPVAHRVTISGTDADLAQTEYRLLHFLLSNPNRVYSRAQLLDHVWGVNHYVEERTVDVHILRLRKALRKHGIDNIVDTVRGAGYRYTVT